ncbi:MAG: class I SAM-dependent methyltransferase [Smithellaceae bacterium]|nr:class I SAM-dependent methyltransferase [Smithellaceae bacterium]
MPGKLKPPSPRLASKLNLQKINGPMATSHKDVDPRICGLIDAVRRGWYQLEKGELFIGFKVTKDDIVLDVGCGEGNAILFCAKQGAHIVFSDVDAIKIKVLTEKAHETKARKVESFVSDTTPLPLPCEYATKILSMEMLEHTLNPEKILAELVRVGKPGAQYLITVPDSRSEMLQKPLANPVYFLEPNHIQIFDQESFVRLVENSGLKVERYDTWGFYWTVFMSLFWIVHQQENFNSSILDSIKPPYHPVLQSWSNTWAGLMELNGSEKLLESFDKYLPKTQVIIARK